MQTTSGQRDRACLNTQWNPQEVLTQENVLWFCASDLAHVSSANLLKYVYSDLLVLRTVGRPMKSQKTGFSYLFYVWQLCILYVYHTHGGFLQLFHFLQLKCGFITSAFQMTSSFIQLFPSLEVSRDIK